MQLGWHKIIRGSSNKEFDQDKCRYYNITNRTKKRAIEPMHGEVRAPALLFLRKEAAGVSEEKSTM